MAVRDEDRRTPRAVGGECEPDLRRGAARIDDDGLGRAPLRAYEVAVRLRGVRAAVGRSRRARPRVYGRLAVSLRAEARYGSAVQSWDLTAIEAPGGTVDPAVLTTDDGARAIAIRLEAGQEMSDHQVRERAWVVVVEGRAEIRSRRPGGRRRSSGRS